MKNEANDAGLQVNEIDVQQSRGIGSSTDVLNEARSFFGFLKGDAK